MKETGASGEARGKRLCCFVVPYFGRLPDTTPAFLKTAGENPAYDWLLFTDDRAAYAYPENVHVRYCAFSEMAARIQACFDFSIALPTPKKLCDFKPAYGDIFAAELADYRFWGYCDLDEFFGNLERFIPEAFLEKFDRLFTHGHMTIYRNTEQMRYLYQTPCLSQPALWHDYREVFSASQNFGFDELDMTQITKSGGGY